MKALQWFNPNIEFQLEGDSPSVLAPLLAIMSRITATPTPSIPEFQEFQDLDSTPELLRRRITQTLEEDVQCIVNSQRPGSRAGGSMPSDQDLIRQMRSINAGYPNRETGWGWFGERLDCIASTTEMVH